MTGRRGAAGALLVVAAVVALLGLVRAASPDPTPTMPERVAAVSATIRCPTCQGLSIQDSPSILATGSRQIVEQQLRAGRTPDQVRQYFVDRYGTSALLSPQSDGPGLLAWLLPAAALPAAGWWGWRRLRRPGSGLVAEAQPEADAALARSRDGSLQPDASPAGEHLREALRVRLALDADGIDDAPARLAADRRLVAAVRRYDVRSSPQEAGPEAVLVAARRTLPRRAVTAVTVAAVLGAAGTALAVGVRDRGAGDLPTGDLPGAAAQQAAPGLRELLAATQRRPDDPQAWTALGQAYDAAQQFGPALEAYDRSLALRPADDVVILLRASLLVRAGSPTEVLPVLDALAQRRPDDPQVLLVRGLAQQAVGAPEAAATLGRFLQLNPEAPQAAMVRSLLGQP